MSFGNGSEGFFKRVPEVFVEFGSGCMADGAYALKARLVTALIDSAPFCDGGLDAGSIGAVNYFGSTVNMAERQESTRADLSINAKIVDEYNDSGVLHPLRLR